jgi:hypothetical protein
MNQVAEPMPPLWTAMLTSSSFQYRRKLDLSTRSVSTKGVKSNRDTRQAVIELSK